MNRCKGAVIVAALAVSVVIFGPQTSQSTVLLQMTIEELTANSDFVVVADIGEQWVSRDEVNSLTHTYTAFTVAEVLHQGPEAQGLPRFGVIQQDGGFTGDYGVYVAGNAHLETGERAVLFLTQGEFFYVLGMEQGKYRIEADTESVERVFRGATVPVAAREIAGTAITIQQPTTPLNGVTLTELVERIQVVGGAE